MEQENEVLDYEQLDVELMSRALSYLDGLPISLQSKQYQSIVRKMVTYLIENCKHRIVEDNIDTAPESSKTVFFCEICYQPFQNKN